MVDVVPFVIPLPDKILNDPELRPYFETLTQFLYGIYQRVGGPTDTIETIEVTTTSESTIKKQQRKLESRVDDLEALMAGMAKKQPPISVLNEDQTPVFAARSRKRQDIQDPEPTGIAVRKPRDASAVAAMDYFEAELARQRSNVVRLNKAVSELEEALAESEARNRALKTTLTARLSELEERIDVGV